MITTMNNDLIKDTNKCMVLKKPAIIDLPDDRVRLSCDIYDNNEKKTLHFEVDKKYGKYLCYERSDAFIISILPYAMLSGQDMYCEAPVTEPLLYNINEVLIPTLASGSKTKYKLIKIHADMDSSPIKGTEVSTGISLGVDSFYTIYENINSDYNDFKLTHLLNISNRISEDNEAIEKVASSLNLPITFVITNVRSLWKSLHKHTHIYTNLGAAYAIRKLIKTYYYSTSHNLNEFITTKTHKADDDQFLLLLANNFTTSDFNVLMGGTPTHRHEKIMTISDQKIVQKNLSVCIKSVFNCNLCWKCKRSIMEFDMLGVLDNYREVFDLDYYLNNKIEYFKILHLRRFFDKYMVLIYDYFLQKEPDLVIQAEKLFLEDVENLSDEDFKAKYRVKNPYNIKRRLRRKLLQDYLARKKPEYDIEIEKLLLEDVKNLSEEDFKAKYGLKKPKDIKSRLIKSIRFKKIKKIIPNPIKKVLKKIIVLKMNII